MEIVLFPSENGYSGILKGDRGVFREVLCRKSGKASTGAEKYVLLAGGVAIGTIVVGEPKGVLRIGTQMGKIIGTAYVGGRKITLGEFTSRKKRKYLKGVE